MVIFLFIRNLDDCFKEDLLNKIHVSMDLAKKEIKMAELFLKEAVELKDLNKELWAFSSLWWAFFHAAKALLWKDGIKEKSHICLIKYLTENYFKTKKLNMDFLNDLEIMQTIRKNLQYSPIKIEIEHNFEELYNGCEEFINKINEIIEK